MTESGCDNLTNESNANNQLSFEQKKNAHLFRLLSDLRSLDASKDKSSTDQSNENHDKVERTYKKALTDYASVYEQLESQRAHWSNQTNELRSRLREKEDKADNIYQTLARYRKDIAQQSSCKNNKPFDMDHFEELVLKSQALDEDVERERLKITSLKVEISQLESQIKKKNDLAGGISDVEHKSLADNINKVEEKLKHCDAELQRNASNKRQLRGMESKLQDEIEVYKERHRAAEQQIQDIDCQIEKKRGYLSRLESAAKEAKAKIGYDAADIEVYLKSQVVNDDFLSSKEEIHRLHVKLNELTAFYATLQIKST